MIYYGQNARTRLPTFCVVSLGPVVASSTLAENKVIWTEDLAVGSCAHGVHGTGLQIEQDGSGDILAGRGLVIVHINALQLQIGCSLIVTLRADAMFVRDNFPKLKKKERMLLFVSV